MTNYDLRNSEIFLARHFKKLKDTKTIVLLSPAQEQIDLFKSVFPQATVANMGKEGWDIIEGKDNADGTGNDIIEWINKNYGGL